MVSVHTCSNRYNIISQNTNNSYIPFHLWKWTLDSFYKMVFSKRTLNLKRDFHLYLTNTISINLLLRGLHLLEWYSVWHAPHSDLRVPKTFQKKKKKKKKKKVDMSCITSTKLFCKLYILVVNLFVIYDAEHQKWAFSDIDENTEKIMKKAIQIFDLFSIV